MPSHDDIATPVHLEDATRNVAIELSGKSRVVGVKAPGSGNAETISALQDLVEAGKSVSQAARYLGIGRSTAYKIISETNQRQTFAEGSSWEQSYEQTMRWGLPGPEPAKKLAPPLRTGVRSGRRDSYCGGRSVDPVCGPTGKLDRAMRNG